MKVFTDLHHFDLYYSFKLLFENRLKAKLYRPIGLEWIESGFYNLTNVDLVNQCYLSTKSGYCSQLLKPYTDSRSADWARFAIELLRVGWVDKSQEEEGLYFVEDISKDLAYVQKAITLDYFKNNEFDIVISSIPQHFELFEKLRKTYQPEAKHIFHMGPGNIEWLVPDRCRNVMYHLLPPNLSKDINSVCYAQEFDTSIFSYQKSYNNKLIFSYVHFPESEDLWNSLALEDWKFKFIGKTLGSLNDVIIDSRELADTISRSAFTWHIKPGGESYGHILANTLSCGRPPIINLEDYEDKYLGSVLEDMVTCIDITNCSSAELTNKILHAYQNHENMCKITNERFKQVVNFDREEINIRRFLCNLK